MNKIIKELTTNQSYDVKDIIYFVLKKTLLDNKKIDDKKLSLEEKELFTDISFLELVEYVQNNKQENILETFKENIFTKNPHNIFGDINIYNYLNKEIKLYDDSIEIIDLNSQCGYYSNLFTNHKNYLLTLDRKNKKILETLKIYYGLKSDIVIKNIFYNNLEQIKNLGDKKIFFVDTTIGEISIDDSKLTNEIKIKYGPKNESVVINTIILFIKTCLLLCQKKNIGIIIVDVDFLTNELNYYINIRKSLCSSNLEKIEKYDKYIIIYLDNKMHTEINFYNISVNIDNEYDKNNYKTISRKELYDCKNWNDFLKIETQKENEKETTNKSLTVKILINKIKNDNNEIIYFYNGKYHLEKLSIEENNNQNLPDEEEINIPIVDNVIEYYIHNKRFDAKIVYYLLIYNKIKLDTNTLLSSVTIKQLNHITKTIDTLRKINNELVEVAIEELLNIFIRK